MKVLVVTNLYPPHSLGGYELSCQDVVGRWRQAGHQVTVLTTATRFAPEVAGAAAPEDDAGVRRELDWYWAEHEIQRPPMRERLRIERANQRRLDAVVGGFAPDVVSLWAMGGMSTALVTRCLDRRLPLALVVGDDWLVYGPRVDAWVAGWARLPRPVAAAAAAATGLPTHVPTLPAGIPIAFVSDYLRRRARSMSAYGVPGGEIVPPGIDRSDFPPCQRRPVDPQDWRWRLLGVGRLEARKGFDTAVRAMALLPQATLRLVGPSDEAQHAALAGLAAELGVADRVEMHALPRDRVAAAYREADALVFPSRWDEPFGLVPLEAMSQGLPVVATRRGGSAEYLTDEVNCLAVEPDDAPGMAAALGRLAADPALRERLLAGGLETAGGYDADTYAADLAALHERAMAAAQ